MDLRAKDVFFEEEFDFQVHDSTEDLHDGHALVSNLEIPTGTIVHKDREYMLENWCTRMV